MFWEEICSVLFMLAEDCRVADSILDVISATSAEWAEASIVEIDSSWAEARLVAEADLEVDFETALKVDISAEAEIVVFLVSDDLRVDLSSEISLPEVDVFLMVADSIAFKFLLLDEISCWETALSLDIVLLLTRGDFCASSWLAFRRLEEAAMADCWIFSADVLK